MSIYSACKLNVFTEGSSHNPSSCVLCWPVHQPSVRYVTVEQASSNRACAYTHQTFVTGIIPNNAF